MTSDERGSDAVPPPAGAPVLELPETALVLLVGIAGCGKSTFAGRHFARTEVLSSDECRALVADDPSDQSATADAFSVLTFILDKRLRRGRITVVDATNVTRSARRRSLGVAEKHGRPAVALVLDLPYEVCLQRNVARTDRNVAPEVLQRQQEDLRRGLARIDEEGYVAVRTLTRPEEVDALKVVRVPADSARPAG